MQLNIGDQVLLWNSTDVEDPWIGPFEVVKVKLHIVYIKNKNKNSSCQTAVHQESVAAYCQKRQGTLSQKSRSRGCVSREKVECILCNMECKL